MENTEKTCRTSLCIILKNHLQSEAGNEDLKTLNSLNVERNKDNIIIKIETSMSNSLEDAIKIFQWTLRDRNENFIPYSRHSPHKMEVVLNGGKLTEETTADIFHTLNKTYKHAEGLERDFMALLAVKVKDTFLDHGQNSMLKKVFSHCSDMFNKGEGTMYILKNTKTL